MEQPGAAVHGPSASTRRLKWALGLTLGYTGAEVVGGYLANSLALLADAGHMFTDSLALGLALAATWFASRPADDRRTYGYQRVEILAALANGVALVVICLHIFWEAWERFQDPPAVDLPLLFGVATGGLVVNLVGAWLLHAGGSHRRHGHGHAGRGHAHGHSHGHSEGPSLNLRGAYLHVLGDLLGSVGALGAAAAIGLAGWTWADAAASAFIGAIVLFSAGRLVWASLNVLLEGAPPGLDSREVCRELEAVDGVAEVHDLHLWSLAGGRPLLTAHLVTDFSRSEREVLRAARALLGARFRIAHATLQVEPPDLDVVGQVPGLDRQAEAARSGGS